MYFIFILGTDIDDYRSEPAISLHFSAQLLGGIDRLAWEAARAYQHRFSCSKRPGNSGESMEIWHNFHGIYHQFDIIWVCLKMGDTPNLDQIKTVWMGEIFRNKPIGKKSEFNWDLSWFIWIEWRSPWAILSHQIVGVQCIEETMDWGTLISKQQKSLWNNWSNHGHQDAWTTYWVAILVQEFGVSLPQQSNTEVDISADCFTLGFWWISTPFSSVPVWCSRSQFLRYPAGPRSVSARNSPLLHP